MKIDRRELARDFVAFCDGCEQGGLVDYARRGRVVAGELLRTIDELDGARSVSDALQAARDRWEALFVARFGSFEPEPSLEPDLSDKPGPDW